MGYVEKVPDEEGYLYEELHCDCGDTDTADRRYDRYGIYAGIYCDTCWPKTSYASFVFDPAYAGESLDED